MACDRTDVGNIRFFYGFEMRSIPTRLEHRAGLINTVRIYKPSEVVMLGDPIPIGE